MFIKQISVFIENRTGRLEEFTGVLSENGIDLLAISLADTTDFGLLRAIVDKTDLAVEKLREAGFTAKLTDVIAVAVPDSPGGLSGVMGLLRQNEIAVEYLYSLVRRVGDSAVIVCRVDKPEQAAQLLSQNNITLLGQDLIASNPQH